MKKKDAVRKLEGIAAQKDKHKLLVEDASLDRSGFFRPHWRRELDSYTRRYEEILGKSSLTEAELKEIETRAKERARKEYLRKKGELKR